MPSSVVAHTIDDLKHADPAGTLQSVPAALSTVVMKVCVKDAGVGMTTEQQSSLFTPYTQV